MTTPDDPRDRARSIFDQLRSTQAFQSRPESDVEGSDRRTSEPPPAPRPEPAAAPNERADPAAAGTTVQPPPHPTGADGPSSTDTSPPQDPKPPTEAGAGASAPGGPGPWLPLGSPTRSYVPTEDTKAPNPLPPPGPPLTVNLGSPVSAAPERLPPPSGGFTRRPHPAAANHQLPRILAIANQKGGVGKTTTTVNLGAALAELGYRVLLVDLDPQGNATTGLGVQARNLEHTVYDVILRDVPVEDVIEPTSIRNLFIVPAAINLAGAEVELVPEFSRELRLRRALDSVKSEYDFMLIDCPPSLGLLTVNALSAAGEVLVPIQCEYYALEGLGQLLGNVNRVQRSLNGDLEVSTIVLTMYDARTKLAEQVAEDVREHFGDKVCRNIIPRTVRLSEAPSFGQPITTFDPSSRGAIAYRELAKEVSGGAPQRVG